MLDDPHKVEKSQKEEDSMCCFMGVILVSHSEGRTQLFAVWDTEPQTPNIKSKKQRFINKKKTKMNCRKQSNISLKLTLDNSN
jgi:hypothetical protein